MRALLEVFSEEETELKNEIERLRARGGTSRYRTPKYQDTGKEVFMISSVIEMELEARACLQWIIATMQALMKT
jgi:hypothetical protein